MRLGTLLALVLLASAAAMGGACSADGLVFDRLDPTGAGDHQCVPAGPAGWLGPFALYDGDPATVPSCAPPFPVTVLRAHADLQRDDAVCSACFCRAPTEVSCKPDSIWLHGGIDCNASLTTFDFGDDGSVCQGDGSANVASVFSWGWDAIGKCAPSPSQTPVINPPAWSREVVGCASPMVGECGCVAGEVCAPSPAAPFDDSVLCVAHPGEVACTSPIYRSRRLVHAGLADDRWCTACSCNFHGSSCSGTLRGHTDSACSNQVFSAPAETGDCVNAAARYFTWTPGAPTNPGCNAQGGDSMGCARPTDPITVCCTGDEDPCPPDMIEIPSPGGGTYCVDATEVTNSRYALFLEAAPPAAGQPPECAWNQTYVPASGWPGVPDNPVTHVDWCDAHAYCAWAGRQLCGAMGGGAAPFDALDDPTASQWYAACSRGGQQSYPYGSQHKSGMCNDGDLPDFSLEPVGFRACCEGGYWGLHDMIGNVAEWEDSCDEALGASDQCRTRGLAPYGSGASCEQDETGRRDRADDQIGIRCCSL